MKEAGFVELVCFVQYSAFEYLGKRFEVVEGHADVNVGEVHRKQEGLSHLYMCMLPRYLM